MSNTNLYSKYGKGQKSINLLSVGRQSSRVSNYKRANNIFEFPINNNSIIQNIIIHNKALLLVDKSFEIRYIPLLRHLIDIGYFPDSIDIQVVNDDIISVEAKINKYYNEGGRLFFGTQKTSTFFDLRKWFEEHSDALYFNSGFKHWITQIDDEIPDNMITTTCNYLKITKFIFDNIICNIHKHSDFLNGSVFDNIFDFVDDSLPKGQVFNQIVYVSDNSDLRLKNNFVKTLQDYIQTNFSKDTFANDPVTLKTFILNLNNNSFTFPDELNNLLSENPLNGKQFASSVTKSIFIFDCFDNEKCQNMLNYFSKKEYYQNLIIFNDNFLNMNINNGLPFNSKFDFTYSFILSLNYSELAYKTSRQLFGDYSTPMPFIDIFTHMLDIFDRIINSKNTNPIARLIEYLINSFSIDRNEWHVKPLYLYGLKERYDENLKIWNFYSSSNIFKKSFNDTNTGTSSTDESWIDTAISSYSTAPGNTTYSINNTNYGNNNASFLTNNLDGVSILFSSMQEITDYTSDLDGFFKGTYKSSTYSGGINPNSTPSIFGIWKVLINTALPITTTAISPFPIYVTVPSQALINETNMNKNYWHYINKGPISYTYTSYNSYGAVISTTNSDTVTIDLDMTYSSDNYLVVFNKGNVHNGIRAPLLINFTLVANQIINKQYRIGDVITINSDIGTNVNATIDSINSDGFTFGVTRFENENTNGITSSTLKQNTGIIMSLDNSSSIAYLPVNPDITNIANNSYNLWSSNGCYYLALLPSGVLVANDYRTGLTFWFKNNTFNNASSLRFRINNNSFIIDTIDAVGNIGYTVLNTNINNNNIVYPLQLVVTNNRNIAIIDNNSTILWSEATNIILSVGNGNYIGNTSSLYSLNGTYNLFLNSSGVLNFTNVTNNKTIYSITSQPTATSLKFFYIINSLNIPTFTLGLYNSSNIQVYNILKDGFPTSSTTFDIENNKLVQLSFTDPYTFKISNNGDLIIVDKNNNICWKLGKADKTTVTQDLYDSAGNLNNSEIVGLSAVHPRQGDYATIHNPVNPQYSNATATIGFINSDKSIKAIFYDENDSTTRSNIIYEKPELKNSLTTNENDSGREQNIKPVSELELHNLISNSNYYSTSIGNDCIVKVTDNRTGRINWSSSPLELLPTQTIQKCKGLVLDKDNGSLYVDVICNNIINPTTKYVTLYSNVNYNLAFYASGSSPITVTISAVNNRLQPDISYNFTPTSSALQLFNQQFSVVTNDTFIITFSPNFSNISLNNGAQILLNDKKVGTGSLYLYSSSSQYVKITDTFTSGTTGLSFSFWFKSNSTATWGRIFDFGNGQANNNIIAFINNNNLGFSVYNGSTSSQINNVIPSINNNTWQHIVWTLDSNNGWKIYLNGNLYSSLSNMNYPNSIQRTLNYIGKSNWSADPYFNGLIDDFRYYNRVLTSNDVSDIYTSPFKSTIYPNIAMYISFDPSILENISITNEEKFYIFQNTNTSTNVDSYSHIIQDDGNLCLYQNNINGTSTNLWCSMSSQVNSWNSNQQTPIKAFQYNNPNTPHPLTSKNGYFSLAMDQGTLGIMKYTNGIYTWVDNTFFKYVGKPFFYSGQSLNVNLTATNKDGITNRTVYNSGTLWQNYSNFNNTASTGNHWNDIYNAVINQFSFSNSDMYNLVDKINVIWVRSNATTNTNNSTAETNNYTYTYTNNTGKIIHSILWVSVLEQCDIYISTVNNGGKIATHGSTSNYGTSVWSYEFDLQPGTTTFSFKNTYNDSGRCGLAFVCFPKYISSCELFLDNIGDVNNNGFGKGNLLVKNVTILAEDGTTVTVPGISDLQPYAITNIKNNGGSSPFTMAFEDDGSGGSDGMLTIINSTNTTILSSKPYNSKISQTLIEPNDRNGILNAGVKLYAQQDEGELESFLWSPTAYSFFGIKVDTVNKTQTVCIFDARFTNPVYTFGTPSIYTTLTSFDAISYIMLDSNGSLDAYNILGSVLKNIIPSSSGYSNYNLLINDSNMLSILGNNGSVTVKTYNNITNYESYILSSGTTKYYNGRILTSSNGNYTLTLDNGSLNINSVNDTSYSSNGTSQIKDINTTTLYANLYTYIGSNPSSAYAIFDTDGVLKVYDSTGIKYSFGTPNVGIPGYKLVLGNTGELAIYDCSIPRASAIDSCSVSAGWSAILSAYNNKLYIGNYGYNNYRWIWNAPNSAPGGPGVPAGTVNFYTTYTNIRTTDITATLYYSVDDTLNVYMNGNKLTSGTVPYNVVWAVTITLKAGSTSFFKFVATNGGGPAGLIFWCLENGNTNDATNTLFYSNPTTTYCSDGIIMSSSDFGIQTWSSGTAYSEIIPYPNYTIDTSDIPDNQLISNEYNFKIPSSINDTEEYTKIYSQNRLYYLRLEIDGSLSIYLSSTNAKIWFNGRPYSGQNSAARIGFYNGKFGLWDSKGVSYGNTIQINPNYLYIFYLGNDRIMRLVGSDGNSYIFNP